MLGISWCLMLGIKACRKVDFSFPTRVTLEWPDYFPAPLQQFEDNPLTKEGIELGRRLFYDDRLAVQAGYSCASCHEQRAAFGTFEHDRSHGVFESHTLRNAPPLFNLIWNSSFHWDGEFESLEAEAVHPITGRLEMGESFANVIKKIERDATYKRLFKQVFQTDKIRPMHIQKALAQFTGSLISADSKYDKVKKGEAQFTALEQQGYALFKTHCNSCHTEPLFTDNSYRNIGLAVDDLLNDYGRYLVTKNPADSFFFKVPSLRNIRLTSNYMHDGRWITLSQVLNHYRSGVQAIGNVDSLVINGIPLSNADVDAIYQFLLTLSDSSFLQNPKYSRPL